MTPLTGLCDHAAVMCETAREVAPTTRDRGFACTLVSSFARKWLAPTAEECAGTPVLMNRPLGDFHSHSQQCPVRPVGRRLVCSQRASPGGMFVCLLVSSVLRTSSSALAIGDASKRDAFSSPASSIYSHHCRLPLHRRQSWMGAPTGGETCRTLGGCGRTRRRRTGKLSPQTRAASKVTSIYVHIEKYSNTT